MASKKKKSESNGRWDVIDLTQEGDTPDVPEQTETSSELTEIVCVLDRSGSMESMRRQAQDGFNDFLAKQKEIESNIIMTVVLFDHEYAIMHDGVDVQDIDPLTNRTYVPRGSTALYDAIGRTMNTVKDRIARSSGTVPTRVLFVILTDGHENASTEFKRSNITQMITDQKSAGWEFIFLGADPSGFDPEMVATIGNQNIMHFAPTGRGMSMAYNSISAAASNYAINGNIGNWREGNGGSTAGFLVPKKRKRVSLHPKTYSSRTH